MLQVLRPKKNGLSPLEYKKILNKRLMKNVKRYEQVNKKFIY